MTDLDKYVKKIKALNDFIEKVKPLECNLNQKIEDIPAKDDYNDNQPYREALKEYIVALKRFDDLKYRDFVGLEAVRQAKKDFIFFRTGVKNMIGLKITDLSYPDILKMRTGNNNEIEFISILLKKITN